MANTVKQGDTVVVKDKELIFKLISTNEFYKLKYSGNIYNHNSDLIKIEPLTTYKDYVVVEVIDISNASCLFNKLKDYCFTKDKDEIYYLRVIEKNTYEDKVLVQFNLIVKEKTNKSELDKLKEKLKNKNIDIDLKITLDNQIVYQINDFSSTNDNMDYYLGDNFKISLTSYLNDISNISLSLLHSNSGGFKLELINSVSGIISDSMVSGDIKVSGPIHLDLDKYKLIAATIDNSSEIPIYFNSKNGIIVNSHLYLTIDYPSLDNNYDYEDYTDDEYYEVVKSWHSIVKVYANMKIYLHSCKYYLSTYIAESIDKAVLDHEINVNFINNNLTLINTMLLDTVNVNAIRFKPDIYVNVLHSKIVLYNVNTRVPYTADVMILKSINSLINHQILVSNSAIGSGSYELRLLLKDKNLTDVDRLNNLLIRDYIKNVDKIINLYKA